MGLLVLDGRDVTEAAVEASVVVPVDPAGCGVLDVGDALVGAEVEHGADALGLLEPVDRLHQRQRCLPGRSPAGAPFRRFGQEEASQDEDHDVTRLD